MSKDSPSQQLALTTIADEIKTGRMEECELSASKILHINKPSSNKAAFTNLTTALSDNKTITKLKIGEITNPEVFTQLLEALETNTSITSLDISGNNALRNFKSLVNLLTKNKNITHLNIDNTHVTMKVLKEIFQNNEQIEELKCSFLAMNSASAAIAGGISNQDGNFVQEYLETNKSKKLLEFLKYPNITIEGSNIGKDLMQIIVEYLVYFNDAVKAKFPTAETNTKTNPDPNPTQGQAQPITDGQAQR